MAHHFLIFTCYTIKAVQIDLVTWSTQRTNRIRPESGRPDYFDGSAAGLHHQKSILVGWFRFSSPKTWKTQTDRKIFRSRPKFPESSDNFPESGEKTQIPAIFPLDSVRFWPNLAKSHQVRRVGSKIAIKPSNFWKIMERPPNPWKVIWKHSNSFQGFLIIFKSTFCLPLFKIILLQLVRCLITCYAWLLFSLNKLFMPWCYVLCIE